MSKADKRRKKILKQKSNGFVLGNGVSRKSININDLKLHGKVYACNAVYRDYRVDYLVSVDTKMVLEIAESNYHHNNEVWTNENNAYHAIPNLNYFKPTLGWSSGPSALHLASSHNYNTIYILGFDFRGINRCFNNIYADTRNYKSSTDRETYYGNWLRQMIITLENNPTINYIRVIDKDGLIPNDLSKISNLRHINVTKFIKLFNLNVLG